MNGIKILAGIALVTAFAYCGGVSKVNPTQEKTKAPDGYKLVWADEFNKDGAPDPASWKHEHGFTRNEEAQWYQPENAWCEKGNLIIEARREDKPNPNYKPDSKNWKLNRKTIEYSGSSINTSGKHSWMYGRFEMRGKIDIEDGCWPAWWTLGVAGSWPSNGEIDIMEYYRKKLLANIATGTDKPYKAKWFANTFNIDSLGGQAWADKFHIWRMDWDENAIALYVDNTLLNKVELDKLVNADGTNINPFKQHHYMLLDFALGGINGGDPSLTQFPRRFVVDYVRVYQKG